MAPETIVGIVVLLAAIAPGFVFIRVVERREPRVERSPLLEAAELALVGGTTTATATLFLLASTRGDPSVDFRRFLLSPRLYVANRPATVVLLVLGILVLSYLLAWLLGLVLVRGRPANIHPNLSVWRAAIHDSVQSSGGALAAVELDDGRVVSGIVFAYTIDPDVEGRELALRRPLFARTSGVAKPTPVDADYIVIPGDKIRYLAISKAN